MLIKNKKPQNDDIVSVKLITGEELLAKLVTFENGVLTLHKPRVLAAGPDGRAIIVPLVHTSDDDDIEIKEEHVLLFLKTSEIAKADYIKITSNIQMAAAMPEGLITPK